MLCVADRTVYHFPAGPDVESSFPYLAQLSRFYYFNLKTGSSTSHKT